MSVALSTLAYGTPKRLGLSLHHLFGLGLLPLGVLTTNLTFGTSLPETTPAIFIAVGMALLVVSGHLRGLAMMWAIALMFLYGVLGAVQGNSVDGIRLIAASAVLLFSIQISAYPETLGLACRFSVYVLLALRAMSIAFPAAMISFYEFLGLRSTHLAGAGPAILFQEPSYLASAILVMWAIGKSSLLQPRSEVRILDLSAVVILALSGSASAALYGVFGLAVVLRHRPLVLVAGVVGAISGFGILLAMEGTRISILLNGMVAIVQSGDIEAAFAALGAIDPSSGFRFAMAMLALHGAFGAPFGHFKFEMSGDLGAAISADRFGVFEHNALVEDFFGNLQGNSVPFQFLYYGGWSLMGVIVILVCVASARIWRSRKQDGAYLLLLFSLACGCFLQSLLTSPFLYLCITYGLTRSHLSAAPGRNDRLAVDV